MLESWLTPILAWLGTGLVPLLLCVIALILACKD